MKLGMRVPDSYREERRWIGSHLLSQLTDDYEIFFENRSDLEIFLITPHHELMGNKYIRMPDIFFSNARNSWLKKESLPRLPLPNWNVVIEGEKPLLAKKIVPIIYGLPGYSKDESKNITLNFDIFGAAFFMLSRYEELVEPISDKHNRFFGEASIAYRAGFIDRPLIDEYCEILCTIIEITWTEFERKKLKFKKIISCDLDHPFTPNPHLTQLLQKYLRYILNPKIMFSRLNILTSDEGKKTRRIDDNYDAIQWIMSENEKRGNRVTFYFIATNSNLTIDGKFNIKQECMRALLRDISRRGHEIGIHPSYGSYDSYDCLIAEVGILRQVMMEEGIKQDLISSRQHYLRWNPSITAAALNAAGLVYDSTLADPFRAGFRCGTCREFLMFDISSRKALNIMQRPLVLMESSVIAKRYMNLGYSDEALKIMKKIKSTCEKFGGNFTLLWHNSHLSTPNDRKFYLDLIG